MGQRAQIIKYTLLPGIIPRIADFVRSGFVHVAYLVALIYSGVRLLPPNHPYLDSRNIGRFGVRHVVAEASNNLVFSRKNIDQIFIYFTILIGLVLLAAQFIILIFGIFSFSSMAVASPTIDPLYSMGLFSNPRGGNAFGASGPHQDLAFIILDLAFGIQSFDGQTGFFDSCVSQDSTDNICEQFFRDINAPPGTLTQIVDTPSFVFPTPLHTALHGMLEFYSYGIFFIAVMVIIYYVITVVAETATSGTPFGQRFNKAWAPVRIIVFFALIIPLNIGDGQREGLNFGQLITFKVAQLGSNMATNAWAYFNTGAIAPGGPSVAGAAVLSQQKSMVAQPDFRTASVSEVIQFIHLAKVCKVAYSKINHGNTIEVKPYLVRNPLPNALGVGGANRLDFITTNFTTARNFSIQSTMTIRFGIPPAGGTPTQWDKEFRQAKGNVKSLCGDLILPLNDVGQVGALAISEGTYNLIKDMWQNDTQIFQSAECLVDKYGRFDAQAVALNCNDRMTTADIEALHANYGAQYQTIVTDAINQQEASAAFGVDPAMVRMGWVGASIFYNKIAEMNGAITGAVANMPFKGQLPSLLEYALIQNQLQNANVPEAVQFNTLLSDPTASNVFLNLDDPIDYRRLRVMRIAYHMWDHLGYSRTDSATKPTGNIVKDYLNLVLGTSGLFEMRNNTDVHPLAQLSSLGKSMMDAAVRNFAIGVGGAIGSSALSLLDQFSSDTAKAAADFFTTMAVATVGIAAVLYYVLPLLPFIYFFFAVSGWVKSIFEAVIAMPLWALAHIRIDGEGLPGPGATNGYYLLLEIFLRPILILLGFIASIGIFAAFVSTLNFVFELVTANVGGFDVQDDAVIAAGASPDPNLASLLTFSRGPIDEFFFTVIYAAICYMMGVSCFKLVDQVPNKILRWAGVSVSTFQENAGDPASQLSNKVYKGSLLVGNQIKQNQESNLAILVS